MEEVVSDQLMLERPERVLGVSDFALVQAMPVDEVGSAGSATPAIGLRHLARRLEAMQVVVAIRRRALDLERLWFLELGHFPSSLKRTLQELAIEIARYIERKPFEEHIARDLPRVFVILLEVGRGTPPVDVLP